jgi:GNAT superfamily N-acetyltransferase
MDWGSLPNQRFKTNKSATDYANSQVEIIKSKNHDGFFVTILEDDNTVEIVAFEPNQIKLADGSNTTFDVNNTDIRFDGGGMTYRQYVDSQFNEEEDRYLPSDYFENFEIKKESKKNYPIIKIKNGLEYRKWGNTGIKVFDNDYVVAVADMKSIQVATQYQKKGIGLELVIILKEWNPNHRFGSMTPQGFNLMGKYYDTKIANNPDIRYTGGGGIKKVKFDIVEDDEEQRITISIKNIGEVILVVSYPEYEFLEDIGEDGLEELGVEEGDMIGKIEHLEIEDKYKGQGYAKLLMIKAIEVAKEKGLMPLYLNASPMGSDGLDIDALTIFYEKLGFQVFLEQGGNNLMILKETYNNGGLIKRRSRKRNQ